MEFNLPIYLYEWEACDPLEGKVYGELFALDDSHAKIQVVNLIFYRSQDDFGVRVTEMKSLMKTVKVKKLYEWKDEEGEEPVVEDSEEPVKSKGSELDELFNGQFSKHLRFFLEGTSINYLSLFGVEGYIKSFYNFRRTHYLMGIRYKKDDYRVFSSQDLDDLTDKVYEYFITKG